jgi:nucleoside phosphorylase
MLQSLYSWETATSIRLVALGPITSLLQSLPEVPRKVAIAHVVGVIGLTFRNMAIGLLVGTGGGVPHLPEKDVRLGDLVVGASEVGPAVIQYDLGKQVPSGFEVTRTLNKPPAQLLNVVNILEDTHMRQEEGDESFFTVHLNRFTKFPRMRDLYKRPSAPDRLFSASYPHENGTRCNEHDKQYEEQRPERNPADEIQIHYSTILSRDRVMKHEVARDQISAEHNNALCFEMEAAGLMDIFPCLVIRGICAYSDSHNNKDWQEYAAATVAAYAREILLTMAERVVHDTGYDPTPTKEVEGHPKSAGKRLPRARGIILPTLSPPATTTPASRWATTPAH